MPSFKDPIVDPGLDATPSESQSVRTSIRLPDYPGRAECDLWPRPRND